MIVGDAQGPALLLSAETAHYIETLLKPQGLRLRARAAGNERVAQELIELRNVALQYRPLVLPEAEAGSAQADPCLNRVSSWLTSVQVADLAGVTDSAVRLACRQERVDARKVGGRWQVARPDAMRYAAAARAA